jgi:hypothetical protein
MKARKCSMITGLVAISFLIGCQASSPGQVALTNRPERKEVTTMPVRDSSTSEDPLKAPLKNAVSGEHMKAFLTAYDAFRQDPLIPEEKRKIENYKVEFRETPQVYYLLFFAKRDAGERELDGGESKLGQDVMYTISRGDYQLKKRMFYK